jgi:RNA polymerase II subunit A small phosphatase-like protein
VYALLPPHPACLCVSAPILTYAVMADSRQTQLQPPDSPRTTLDTTASAATAISPSSPNHSDHSSTTVPGQPVVTSRRSKRSLRSRARAGSNASSKRSHRARPSMSEKPTRPLSGATTQSNPARPKKKSKFLSFLGCCGSSDDAQDGGQDVPSRQSVPAQAAQVDQQPSMNSNPTMQSVDTIDEKPSTTPYLAEPSGTSANAGSEKMSTPVSSQPESRGEGLYAPPLMAAGMPSTGSVHGQDPQMQASSDAPYLTQPEVVVQAPTPIIGSAEDDLVIADRTPEQQALDTDIEMTDVGPSIPLSANDVAGTSEDEGHVSPHRESGTRIDLPPPPPLVERQAQVAHPNTTSHDTSLVPGPEPQKWLLPAVRPEHKGRKCLILDLDETLVHSSFKVGHDLENHRCQKLTMRKLDLTPGGYDYSCRNRGNIP